ncbi:MAG: DUF5362 family protein [Bacillota bacterium]
MIDQENLKSFSTWTGFVGIITIIGGALSALVGVFALIVGAVPGIVTIFLGIKLLKAKKSANELINITDTEQYNQNLNALVNEVTTYFKIQGILVIIGLAFAVFAMFTGVLASIIGIMGSM